MKDFAEKFAQEVLPGDVSVSLRPNPKASIQSCLVLCSFYFHIPASTQPLHFPNTLQKVFHFRCSQGKVDSFSALAANVCCEACVVFVTRANFPVQMKPQKFAKTCRFSLNVLFSIFPVNPQQSHVIWFLSEKKRTDVR